MGEDVRTLDFGGRDAFEGELATGFTDRPLGYADTEHQIQIPDVSKLKTNIAKVRIHATSPCMPCSSTHAPPACYLNCCSFMRETLLKTLELSR